MSYFRENIDAMSGYVPGEQPKTSNVIKLNTNENPYAPSSKAVEALNNYAIDNLRKYPEPVSQPVIDAAVKVLGVKANEVIVGNGSDDILTIIFRSFANEGDFTGWLDPSYSLYPVLADIQGAKHRFVELNEDFSLPENIAEQAKGCSVFFLTNPNAPTTNSFSKAKVREFCTDFEGIVVIDEAYADFSDENCLELYKEFPNVIVTRTFSKSYSLAGIRVGMAFANENLINGMLKVKDSYNVNALSQTMAAAALLDVDYFNETVSKIKATRARTEQQLTELNFKVCPSQTNFIFAEPPIEAATFFNALKEKNIFIRYFKGGKTGKYVRITIGTDEEMDAFFKATKEILG
ncbi:MAG: histidinol-phosphate transaminase [Lentisphaeraceae bacterium]|nr:histidinol-phosphate transaminase [Lentisphaeraceae bacterium]